MALQFQFLRIHSDLRIFRMSVRSTYDMQMGKKYSQMWFMYIYMPISEWILMNWNRMANSSKNAMFLMFIQILIFSATILCLMEGDVWERGTMFPNQVDLTRDGLALSQTHYSTNNVFNITHFIVTDELYSPVRIVHFVKLTVLRLKMPFVLWFYFGFIANCLY